MLKFITDMSAAVKDFARTDDELYLKKLGYSIGTTIGEGSYAKVKSAYSETLQQRVAMKIINRKKAPKDFKEKFLPRELEVLKHVNHPHVIKMYEILEFDNKIYIVMEHAGHGDLLEYIKLRGVVPDDKARRMFRELCEAVWYLHANKIAHRDLKCENLLLDHSNSIKVSDFGFARYFDPNPTSSEHFSKTFCGSAAYAAPEILQGIAYSPPLHDIWAMGIILYIMVCASMPYDDSNIKKMIQDQLSKKVGFSRSKVVAPEAKDLIRRILEVSVNHRYTLQQIMAHVWLNPPASASSDKPGPSGNDKVSDQMQMQPKVLPEANRMGDVGERVDGGKKGERTGEEPNDDTVAAMT